MTALKRWLTVATLAEKDLLAKYAKTSRNQLYQLAGGHRNCSAEAARRIEQAAARVQNANPKLPTLLRTDLSKACAACEFARACLGKSR